MTDTWKEEIERIQDKIESGKRIWPQIFDLEVLERMHYRKLLDAYGRFQFDFLKRMKKIPSDWAIESVVAWQPLDKTLNPLTVIFKHLVTDQEKTVNLTDQEFREMEEEWALKIDTF